MIKTVILVVVTATSGWKTGRLDNSTYIYTVQPDLVSCEEVAAVIDRPTGVRAFCIEVNANDN